MRIKLGWAILKIQIILVTTWCKLLNKLADHATGLEYLLVYLDAAEDLEHYGAGKDLNLVRALGRMKVITEDGNRWILCGGVASIFGREARYACLEYAGPQPELLTIIGRVPARPLFPRLLERIGKRNLLYKMIDRQSNLLCCLCFLRLTSFPKYREVHCAEKNDGYF